jgi:glycosyl transferase, family 25
MTANRDDMSGAGARVYLINLDRSVDRLRVMTNQARSIGFDFERVPGIDGITLTKEQIAPYRVNPSARPLSPGEVGCWLSHRRAWERVREVGQRWGIILEDDCHISPGFAQVRADLWRAPADADIIRIEAWPGKRKARVSYTSVELGGRALHILRSSLFGAAGYAISSTACERLLADSDPGRLGLPVDQYLFHLRSPVERQLAKYVLIPAPVIQDWHLDKADRLPELSGSLIRDRARIPSQRIPRYRKMAGKLVNVPEQLMSLLAARRRLTWR